MGLGRVLACLAIIISIVAVILTYVCSKYSVLPEIDDNGYWGRKVIKRGEKIPDDSTKINKFRVKVSQATLDDLNQRLGSARFVEPLVGTNFEYGFNGNKLQEVVNYWQTSYNWTLYENELNKFNQFKTQIEGINVHFLHVKPAKPAKTVVPLLLVHGWPGTVWEFYKMIPMLTTPDADGLAFEIIAPSIPGFGFSEAPHQPGFNVIAASRVFVKLMQRLGHGKFYFHGDDWGSAIGRVMGLYFPDRLLGLHINFLANMNTRAALKIAVGWLLPSLVFDDPKSDVKLVSPCIRKAFAVIREGAFFIHQATKPDTLGAAMVDSPVGLAAYLIERFSAWVDGPGKYIHASDGGIGRNLNYDELLTTVMIHWVTGSSATSFRFYKEAVECRLVGSSLFTATLNHVPVGFASYPHEVPFANWPRAVVTEMFGNLIHYTKMARGSHYGPFEEPELTVDDVRLFVHKCMQLDNR